MAIKSLERKGLLKVFRTYEKTNKYFIGEKEVNTIKWYGKNFKGWKEGEDQPPLELTENEETESTDENIPAEKTPFEEIRDMEIEQDRQRKNYKRKNGYEETRETKNFDEKKYL